MRTLKKTLCLVLAVVMILGLGVIGVSAKDYTDSDSVAHKEAVAVLSAVGVFEGDDNGAFNGSKALTRAEGAAVVTRLLGVENPNGATTFADTANHWAKGYIAYCADLGIMNGYGDGNFGPDDPLTASAFAKFLLVALGYNPVQENMTGASWEIGVTKLVNVINLADGMGGLSYTGAITRDDAAKMAFNCLKKNMVEYVNNKTITSGDFSMVENYEATPVRNTSYSYQMHSNTRQWTGDEVRYAAAHDGYSEGLMQFVENYFPNLKLEKKEDDFGVQQNYWYLASSRTDYNRDKSEDIVTEGADDLLATYTDAVTPKTIRDVIGSSAVDALEDFGTDNTGINNADYGKVMYVYIDGVLLTTDDYGADAKTVIKHWAGTANGSSDNIPELGRGVITRVYRNVDDQIVTIAVNGVYLAKATANFDGDELPVEVYNNGYGLFDNDAVGMINYATNSSGNVHSFLGEIKQEDVDVSSFKKDDYLLITATATGGSASSPEWKYQTVELAETVEDTTLNSYRYVPQGNRGAAGNIVAGGKFYMFNLSAEINDGAKGYKFYNEEKSDELKVNDNTYKFWLDKNGYIIGLDEVESTVKAEDYLFVTAVDASTLEAKAKVVFLSDGTEKTITVNKLFGTDNSEYKTAKIEEATNTGSKNGGEYGDVNGVLAANYFYKFKEKSSGEYELTKVRVISSNGDNKAYDENQSASTIWQTTKFDAMMTAAKTNPFTTSTDYAALFANAKSVTVADKHVYIGVRNFPDVSSKTGDKVAFYALADKNQILAAYTEEPGTGAADKNQYALLIGGPGEGKDGDDRIYTYDALVNGEMTQIVVSGDSDNAYQNNKATMMFDISTTDSKGYAKLQQRDLVTSADVGSTKHDLVMNAVKVVATEGNAFNYGLGQSKKTHYLKVDDDVLVYDNGTTKTSIAVVDSNTKYYHLDNLDGHAAKLKGNLTDGTVANLNTGTSNWLIYALKDGSKDKAASIVYFVELSGTKFIGQYANTYNFLNTINPYAG